MSSDYQAVKPAETDKLSMEKLPEKVIPIGIEAVLNDDYWEDEEQEIDLINPISSFDRLNTATLSEIYDLKPTDDLPIIDGLLYPGVYLLAGAPKTGKSFLAAQIAFSVSMGRVFLGHKTHPCEVLYLALEDSLERLQRRFGNMFDYEGSETLHLAVRASTVEGTLMEQLNHFIQEHPKVKLIIIDTLVMIKDRETVQFSYTNDYKLIGKIKQFADIFGLGVLLIHHTRKMKDQDQFNMISGTNGIFGASDGAWILSRESRQAREAILSVTGRDQPDAVLSLIQDPKTCLWEIDHEDSLQDQPIIDPVVQALCSFSGWLPSWSGTATELKEMLHLDEIPVNTITKRLNANRHLLKREFGIQYDYRRTGDSRIITLIREAKNQG